MPRVKHSTEQIIAKLRKAELLLVDGKSIDYVVKALNVTKNTYYRWKKEYGNLQVDQAKKLKDLEKENARLGGTPFLLQLGMLLTDNSWCRSVRSVRI